MTEVHASPLTIPCTSCFFFCCRSITPAKLYLVHVYTYVKLIYFLKNHDFFSRTQNFSIFDQLRIILNVIYSFFQFHYVLFITSCFFFEFWNYEHIERMYSLCKYPSNICTYVKQDGTQSWAIRWAAKLIRITDNNFLLISTYCDL